MTGVRRRIKFSSDPVSFSIIVLAEKNDIAMLRKFLRKVLGISLRLRKPLRKVLGIRSTNDFAYKSPSRRAQSPSFGGSARVRLGFK